MSDNINQPCTIGINPNVFLSLNNEQPQQVDQPCSLDAVFIASPLLLS